MKILITGGHGQLGCSLQAVSGEYSLHSFIFTDMPQTDITDAQAIDRIVVENGIDVIVNCAAYTAVDRAEAEPLIARKINVDGVKVLAQVAKEHSVKLVHISTDYVFSGEACHPLRESDEPDPQSVYGQTKLRGEQVIAEVGGDAAVIRTSWLYSEYGANFVKTMLRLGAERGALSVVYDQIGTPTYAPDLARAIMSVIEHGVSGYEVYHFSNEGIASWYDFAHQIFKLASMEVAVSAVGTEHYPTPAKRPAYSVLSKDKIKGIGVVVPYWRDSLEVCIAALLTTTS